MLSLPFWLFHWKKTDVEYFILLRIKYQLRIINVWAAIKNIKRKMAIVFLAICSLKKVLIQRESRLWTGDERKIRATNCPIHAMPPGHTARNILSFFSFFFFFNLFLCLWVCIWFSFFQVSTSVDKEKKKKKNLIDFIAPFNWIEKYNNTDKKIMLCVSQFKIWRRRRRRIA